jgi:hypothetical protein
MKEQNKRRRGRQDWRIAPADDAAADDAAASTMRARLSNSTPWIENMILTDFPLLKSGFLLALLLVQWGCGDSANSGDPPSSSSGASAGAPPPESSGSPPVALINVPPETVEAVTNVIEMAASQLQAACGTTFDTCTNTMGCGEILACAARNGCAGNACYCVDASCQTAGPCRSVIETAPGARAPDAENPSLGPAADAAAAVAECLVGLGSGVSSPPPNAGSGDADVD